MRLVARRTRLALVLLTVLALCGFDPTASRYCVAGEARLPTVGVDDAGSRHLKWEPIATNDIITVYNMLSTQTHGNYDRLRTWKGDGSVLVRRRASPHEVRTLLPTAPATPLTQVVRFTLAIAIDLETNKIFYDKTDMKMSWVNTDTDQPVTVPGVRGENERAVLTSQDCLSFLPDAPPGDYDVLPDHPRARHKRAAFRDAAESSRSQLVKTLPDPRRYFGRSPGQRFWESLEGAVAALRGEGRRGAEGAKIVRDGLRLYQATGDGGVWYRQDEAYRHPGEKEASEFNRTVWSAAAGFNPVSFDVWRGAFEKDLVYRVRWQWYSRDGIYVPAAVTEVMYTPGKDATQLDLDHETEVKFANTVLNAPLAEQQFTYAALGLKNGDLVLDRVEDVVYIMNDGKAEKLANFHARFLGKSARRTTYWVFLGVLVFAICFAGCALVARVRRGSRQSSSQA